MIYGYIYKLFCLDTREMYIGSTKNLKKRIGHHKEKTNTYTSKQIINRNNYIFLILQEGFYVNKDHLIAIEDNYICKLPCINFHRPFLTKYEYYKNNKDSIILREKIYRQNKKDLISLREKIYRQNNKEKIRTRQNEYYEKNKEYFEEKIPCEFCKKLGSRSGKSRHIKTCKQNPNNLISQVNV